ncbi:MAG TPA: c-type cytochrome domain-containing protein [Candidatus Acidoferrum sp.]|jgi:uncharacterized membrane protein|nr:c-type cytochrome domain-containing protein [Candidatus Acidoferrum sp.]
MAATPNDLVLFVGRFHPLLVHLPIGVLALVGTLELLARWPRFKTPAQNSGLMLGLAATGAVASAFCGWLLSQSGDYDAELLRWHKWAGFSLAAACIATLLVNLSGRLRAYRLCLAATLALLVVTGHFGASITHGRDFLTHYAPGPLRRLLGGSPVRAATPAVPADPLQRRVFADVIQPILRQRCWACHSAEKQKANLRLDGLEGMLKGGKNGPALVVGKASESPMLQRLLLPLDDDDHMPPNGKPQPATAQINLLQWWINAGTPTNGLVGDVPGGEELQRLLGVGTGAATPH